jgi:hypothetical protein
MTPKFETLVAGAVGVNEGEFVSAELTVTPVPLRTIQSVTGLEMSPRAGGQKPINTDAEIAALMMW